MAMETERAPRWGEGQEVRGGGGVGGWGRKRGVGGEVEVRERAVAQRCDAQVGDARPIVDGPLPPPLPLAHTRMKSRAANRGVLKCLVWQGW